MTPHTTPNAATSTTAPQSPVTSPGTSPLPVVVEAAPAAVARVVWETMLTLRESDRGPLHFRHAPLLATGDLGGAGVPMSSILTPSGLRASLVRALGLAEADADLHAAASDGAGQALTALRAGIAAFAELPPERQAELLSCLNCLTEQATVISLVPRATPDHPRTAAGSRVLYEVGRALLRRYNPLARPILEGVAESTDPVLRVLARVQLGAMAVRLRGDLENATAQVDAARGGYAEAEADLDGFLRALLQSRVSRLAALVALRRTDPSGQAAAMERSLETALELERLSRTRPRYDRLVAAENMKIVAESHLKAAGGARDAGEVTRWATTMLSIDPDDPGTWRDIAANTARCGLTTEAAIAAVGMTYVGGAGTVATIQAIVTTPLASTPPTTPPSGELRQALAGAIAGLAAAGHARLRGAP
ncbi:hypothetical protein [Nonomuraea sp. NPDC050783]|uniref:hypothetical protein n=1 Tax=Nonomuraea sp. NPDC050783 TaxID=3154634 RepID=UPI003465D1E7